jgi:hypothetical protein
MIAVGYCDIEFVLYIFVTNRASFVLDMTYFAVVSVITVWDYFSVYRRYRRYRRYKVIRVYKRRRFRTTDKPVQNIKYIMDMTI